MGNEWQGIDVYHLKVKTHLLLFRLVLITDYYPQPT